MLAGQPRLRVLVVENEVLLRLDAEDALQELGHDVVGWADRARTAISEAERTRPDLVLMDIQLDGPRDGVDAAHEIRDRFGIASLFVTGTSDNETYRRALTARPLGYLRKPLVLSELKSTLAPLAHALAPDSSAMPSPPMANVQLAFVNMMPKTTPDALE